jgi:anthranilate phosphoribosyltransferase
MDSFKKLTKLKNHLQDLTEQEAYTLMKKVLNGDLSPIKIASFLTAMRIKGETPEEILGFVRAVKETARKFPMEGRAIDLSLNYDGKVKTLFVLPSALFIVQKAGINLVYHFADRVPAKEGITLNDIIEALGNKFVSKGLLRIHQKDLAPKLYGLLPLRRELGFRTFLNVIEKLINPADTDRIITSVFHKPYLHKLAEVLPALGFKKFLIVKGLEGGIEPHPNKPTLYIREGLKPAEFEPSRLGIKLPDSVFTKEIVRDSVDINLRIVRGEAPQEFINWALLTAGFILFLGKETESPEEGFLLARSLL